MKTKCCCATGYEYNRNLLMSYMDVLDKRKVYERAVELYHVMGFVFRQWEVAHDMRLFALKYGFKDDNVRDFVTTFQDHGEACRPYWSEPVLDDEIRGQLERENKHDYMVFGAAQGLWLSRWTDFERQFAAGIKRETYHCSKNADDGGFCGHVGKIYCELRDSPPPPVTPAIAVNKTLPKHFPITLLGQRLKRYNDASKLQKAKKAVKKHKSSTHTDNKTASKRF